MILSMTFKVNKTIYPLINLIYNYSVYLKDDIVPLQEKDNQPKVEDSQGQWYLNDQVSCTNRVHYHKISKIRNVIINYLAETSSRHISGL